MSALMNNALPIQHLVALTSVTILTAFFAYWYQSKKKCTVPKIWEPIARVTQLYLYPLKSGHRIELKKAECTEYGLKQGKEDEKTYQLRDRCFIVYNESDREFRTARTYPKMVLIEVSVHDSEHIAFDAPGMRTLYVKIPQPDETNRVEISFHGNEKLLTYDCGNEAATWISRYTLENEKGFRLGCHDGVYRRNITKVYKQHFKFFPNLGNGDTGMYSDLSAFLLVNQTSVDDLNTRIGNSAVSVNNFRPNIVVQGENAPAFFEDDWDWIKIGDVIMRNVHTCGRCVFTTIDPVTGIRSNNREPLKTLQTYRKPKNSEFLKVTDAPNMGINLGLYIAGEIAVGDVVYIGK